MVTRVLKLKRTLKLFLVLAGLLTLQQEQLHAQVQFFTAPPQVDSFPVVKSKVSIAYNGRPAPITKSNLTVLEDGQNMPFELLDCDESDAASIAVLFDVSESMMVTLFKGNDEFYRAFIDFTLELTPNSELALVPFNDSVRRVIPASYRTQEFFQMNVPADVDEFLDSVGSLRFSGNTNVDLGIWTAAQHLKKGVNRRKAIVLVTDDGIYDRESLIALLRHEEISLFVLELDADTIKGNLVTANETGGKFFSPQDSTEIAPTMSLIARAIYAKKCTLRYVSNHPCPWWSDKTLWIGLNYQKQNLAETHYFSLGPNIRDVNPPKLTETPITTSSLIVRADEMFPCELGIRSFTDSALVNFAKISRVTSLPFFAYDSLVVVDINLQADGYYIAIDSNGNRSKLRIGYTPEPDLLSPLWNVPVRTAPEQYQLTATELRKWDRGLKDIAIAPGSVNIRLDSLVYASSRLAQVYLSRIDPSKAASACVVAIDSVDHDSSTCISFDASVFDTYPPQITQRPFSSPLVAMAADITEQRAGDRGILSISVSAGSNVTASVTNYVSPFTADVISAIADSLYPAEVVVTAVDSVGNSSELTLSYSPLPDLLSPDYVLTVDDLATRSLSITESRAWDRGLRSIVSVQSSNVTVSALSESRRLSTWRVAAIDPYTVGTASIEAIDSAGNSSLIDISIPAQAPPEQLPLTYTDPLDFGSVQAPTLMKLSVNITNPNNGAVAITRGVWSGDDSVFSLAGVLPTQFGPAGDQAIAFNYYPKLLGDWAAVYTIETADGAKYPIRLKGSSVGALELKVSNESVAVSGDRGVLALDISGSPDVIDLDTIQVTLAVGDDVISLLKPENTCASSDWICNYDLTWLARGNGQYDLSLIRKSPARSLELSSSPVLNIPFKTYLSDKRSSDVALHSLFASRSTVSGSNGSVMIGEACGDSVIVDALTSQIAGIKRLTIDDDRLRVEFAADRGQRLRLTLFDLRGRSCMEILKDVVMGDNQLEIPCPDLISGAYRLVIVAETATYSRSVNIVR